MFDCFLASGALKENEFAPVEMTLPLNIDALSQAKTQDSNSKLPVEE